MPQNNYISIVSSDSYSDSYESYYDNGDTDNEQGYFMMRRGFQLLPYKQKEQLAHLIKKRDGNGF